MRSHDRAADKTQISISMSKTTMEAVRAIAVESRRSLSGQIEYMLLDQIKTMGQKPSPKKNTVDPGARGSDEQPEQLVETEDDGKRCWR
jgi:hypothetical protein